MSEDNAGLVAQIEADLISERPLPGILRKCLILSGQVGSDELRDWVTQELEGYRGGEPPAYRTVDARIHINGQTVSHQISGQPVGPEYFPEDMHDIAVERYTFTKGVDELAAILAQYGSSDRIEIAFPRSSAFAAGLTANRKDGSRITDVFWVVSASSVEGILGRIRTALTKLVVELRPGMLDDQQIPAADATDRAVKYLITGDRPIVQFATGSGGNAVTTVATQKESGSWRRWGRVGGFVVGAVGVIGVLVAVADALGMFG